MHKSSKLQKRLSTPVHIVYHYEYIKGMLIYKHTLADTPICQKILSRPPPPNKISYQLHYYKVSADYLLSNQIHVEMIIGKE